MCLRIIRNVERALPTRSELKEWLLQASLKLLQIEAVFGHQPVDLGAVLCEELVDFVTRMPLKKSITTPA